MSNQPFAPPKEYQFEPELLGKLPRPVPPELRQGLHGLSRYASMRACLIVGFLCIASAETSFVQTASYYFLPLTFTRWIGALFLLAAGWEYFQDVREAGPYQYMKLGTPFIARVLQLVCQPTAYYNGQPTRWKIFAGIEYPGPDGTLVRELTPSFDLGNRAHQYTTSFKVGDYVTGLYWEGAKPGERRRLYGFLGLKPGLGVVPRVATHQGLFIDQLKVIGGAFALIFGLLAAMFYGGRALPIDVPGRGFWLGCLALPLVAAVPLHRWLVARAAARMSAWAATTQAAHANGEVLVHDPRGAAIPRPHGKRGTAVLVFLLYLGTLFGVASLNALLDRSQPEAVPVRIDRLIHTTWNGCIRDYSIKYHLLDPQTGNQIGSEESFATTATHMETFKTRAALARIGRGAFGWRWVRTIEPYRIEGNTF